MLGMLKKIFGTAQTRLLRRYAKLVGQVNVWEERFQALSDEELKAKTGEFRARTEKGESLEALLPEAYAVVKNACRRLCGTDVHVSGYDQKWDMVPYDVQILGAIAMHFGAIAEMQTGEGKTLTASLPLYLNALSGKPVHLVTVNDYLAQRDCEWVGTIFRYLGLNVKALLSTTPHQLRTMIYQADIVYGTASEFGFDYLRDNSMAQSKDEQCQRGYFFAIIDEVDSILIDEARTPLIISGPSPSSRQMYDELKHGVGNLVRLQREQCNKLATEARKTLEILGLLVEGEKLKLDKKQEQEAKAAFRQLWLVGKGTPQNKLLKRTKEDPDLRAQIETWETYYHAEPNKQERIAALSELYIIVDERANEYELTDKGIRTWIASEGKSEDDFIMLDLGHEYLKIEQNPEIQEQEKLQRKVSLREEDAKRKEKAHNLRQLFRAHLLMERDVDYIISEGKIVIIDENTGRPQPGRRFSDGLHQAIEAKEGLAIQQETQTYATITLQNYFRMYHKLSGMTGTAMTEATEFKDIYKLEVLSIPTHRPCIRTDADDEIYMSEREKYNAILKDIQEVHSQGRPILIGTESVEVSEKLSRILKQNKLEHTVLNAKNHAKEAEIIAQAGKKGAITVATNMAGRGTDIKLKEGTAGCGGLHVIGTTRHQSRRIDRQLRGRSARLGDPGSSKFYVSFEDSLMRLFTSPRITAFLQRFRPPEGEPISAKVLNKSIETAQKRVEGRNYTMRKHTLEYDDVMNKQREEIYTFRNEVLHTENPLLLAEEILESTASAMSQEEVVAHFPVSFDSEEKNLQEKVLASFRNKIAAEQEALSKNELAIYPGGLPPEGVLKEIVRNVLIRTIDQYWQEHLLHIDHLRAEVHLRTIGQKDPLLEFKHEAFALFEELSTKIKQEIAHSLFKFSVVIPAPVEEKESVVQRRRERLQHRTDLSLLPEP